MRSRASTGPGSCAGSTTEGASAAITMRARRARSAVTEAAAISTVAAEATAISAVASEATTITAVAAEATTITAEAATTLRCGGGAFQLELGCHGLAAVLGHLERHTLALAEGLRAGCCQ